MRRWSYIRTARHEGADIDKFEEIQFFYDLEQVNFNILGENEYDS